MNSIKRTELEIEEKWQDAAANIPYFDFGKDVVIKPLPPQYGAIISFLLKKGNRDIHVKLENTIFVVPEDFMWTIYPDKHGQITYVRIRKGHEDLLLEHIKAALDDSSKPSILVRVWKWLTRRK